MAVLGVSYQTIHSKLHHSGPLQDEAVSGPKLPRHCPRNCGWICVKCGIVCSSPGDFGTGSCPSGRGKHDPTYYRHRCENCPCLSNDVVTFLREPCTQEYLARRELQRQKLLESIREETKKQEKLRLLKMLEEEREKLQSIMAAKDAKKGILA